MTRLSPYGEYDKIHNNCRTGSVKQPMKELGRKENERTKK